MADKTERTEIKITAYSPFKKYEIIFKLQKGKDVTLNSVIDILNGEPGYTQNRAPEKKIPYRNDNNSNGALKLVTNKIDDDEPTDGLLDINNCWIRAMVSTLKTICDKRILSRCHKRTLIDGDLPNDTLLKKEPTSTTHLIPSALNTIDSYVSNGTKLAYLGQVGWDGGVLLDMVSRLAADNNSSEINIQLIKNKIIDKRTQLSSTTAAATGAAAAAATTAAAAAAATAAENIVITLKEDTEAEIEHAKKDGQGGEFINRYHAFLYPTPQITQNIDVWLDKPQGKEKKWECNLFGDMSNEILEKKYNLYLAYKTYFDRRARDTDGDAAMTETNIGARELVEDVFDYTSYYLFDVYRHLNSIANDDKLKKLLKLLNKSRLSANKITVIKEIYLNLLNNYNNEEKKINSTDVWNYIKNYTVLYKGIKIWSSTLTELETNILAITEGLNDAAESVKADYDMTSILNNIEKIDVNTIPNISIFVNKMNEEDNIDYTTYNSPTPIPFVPIYHKFKYQVPDKVPDKVKKKEWVTAENKFKYLFGERDSLNDQALWTNIEFIIKYSPPLDKEYPDIKNNLRCLKT